MAQGNHRLARDAFLLILFFLAGAMVATALVETAKRVVGKGHYTVPLLVECALLSVVALGAVAGAAKVPFLLFLMTGLLSFSMGLQNALVTKISGAVVRTTHLTGVTTDFGIEIVRLFFWFRDRARGKNLRDKFAHARQALRDPEMHKAWLHLTILFSFAAGAIAGPMVYVRHGMAAMGLPVAVLLLLVGVDQTFRRMRQPAAGPVSAGSDQTPAT